MMEIVFVCFFVFRVVKPAVSFRLGIPKKRPVGGRFWFVSDSTLGVWSRWFCFLFLDSVGGCGGFACL